MSGILLLRHEKEIREGRLHRPVGRTNRQPADPKSKTSLKREALNRTIYGARPYRGPKLVRGATNLLVGETRRILTAPSFAFASGRNSIRVPPPGSGGGGNSLDINHTIAGAEWSSVYNPVNGTGTGNPAVLDDNSGTTKWSGFNGGGVASTLAIYNSGANYYKGATSDGTSAARMSNVTAKWRAPVVGEYIIYSWLFGTSYVASVGASHPVQVARSVVTNYFFFTHMCYTDLRTGPPGTPANSNWWVLSPYQLSYPNNNWNAPIVNGTSYVINLKLYRESSTVARMFPRIYNLDGTVYKDTNEFSNGNDDPLGTHNLLSDNPVLDITGGNDDNFYGSMECGNNGDSSWTNLSNFQAYDNHSVFITSDSSFWVGARTPV